MRKENEGEEMGKGKEMRMKGRGDWTDRGGNGNEVTGDGNEREGK